MSFDLAGVPAPSRPFVISFSGIDGAGKTTQIERLVSHLEEQGLRVLRFSFWEHVAVWPNLRTEIGYRALDREATRKEDLSFSPRNNKYVRKWYLTVARSAFYFFDISRLHRLLSRQSVRDHDVLIFDRYIYDQIANVYSQSFAARAYGKLVLSLAPAPDLAFVLDASPTEAFARKPEYPLEFVYRNRRSFLQLRELDPKLVILPANTVEEVAQQIQNHLWRSGLLARTSPTEKAEAPRVPALLPTQTFRTAQEEPTAKI